MPARARKRRWRAPNRRARCSTYDRRKLLFLTNAGNCYAVGVAQIPECRLRDRGLPLGGPVGRLEKDERLVHVLAPGREWAGEIALITEGGLVKRLAVSELNVRKARYAALTLRAGDQLAAVVPPTSEGDLLVVTRPGHGHLLCAGGK